MSSESTSTRSSRMAGSAATVIALMSMATMVSAHPGVPGARLLPAEANSSSVESPSMREMAVAVVAAAARNLLASDRLDTAFVATVLTAPADTSRLEIRTLVHEAAPRRSLVPDERLIDLPPPAC